jgi:hypothetical protein
MEVLGDQRIFDTIDATLISLRTNISIQNLMHSYLIIIELIIWLSNISIFLILF